MYNDISKRVPGLIGLCWFVIALNVFLCPFFICLSFAMDLLPWFPFIDLLLPFFLDLLLPPFFGLVPSFRLLLLVLLKCAGRSSWFKNDLFFPLWALLVKSGSAVILFLRWYSGESSSSDSYEWYDSCLLRAESFKILWSVLYGRSGNSLDCWFCCPGLESRPPD